MYNNSVEYWEDIVKDCIDYSNDSSYNFTEEEIKQVANFVLDDDEIWDEIYRKIDSFLKEINDNKE